jgi:hypothetical protein
LLVAVAVSVVVAVSSLPVADPSFASVPQVMVVSLAPGPRHLASRPAVAATPVLFR